jgi:YgiT-type zinc finger domain-containing protein
MTIGENGSKRCPTCGGRLEQGLANIPFIFDGTVIVVKQVPAEICSDCHEPFMAGYATDEVMSLLNQLRTLPSEVTVVNYPAPLAV